MAQHKIITSQWIQNLPKVELHVHLEGSITKEKALQIWQRQDKQVTTSFIDKLYSFNDFNGFLQALIQTMRLLQVEDFYDITCQFLAQAAEHNIVYSEVFFTPFLCSIRDDLPLAAVLEAIEQGVKKMKQEKNVDMRLIFDAPRNCGIEAVTETVRQAANTTSGLVIGVGLGGDEANFPAKDFIQPFAYAKSLGLARIIHAGETAPVESIADAVYLLHANRIGHALGLSQHDELQDYIKQNEITLDLCLTSNKRTNLIENITDHPVKEYSQQGLPITINTDDPGFFQTNLSNELSILVNQFHYTPNQVKALIANAVNASYMPIEEKRNVFAKLAKY